MKKKNIYSNHEQYIRLQHLFSSYDRLFYPQDNVNIFFFDNIFFIYLSIHLFICLLICLFIYLSIYLFVICFNNNRT